MNFQELLKNKFTALFPSNRGEKNLVHSKVFCMAPWIQLHATPEGEVTPCCMSAYKGDNVGSLRQNSNLLAAWNSEKMKRFRLNMLEGKKNSICSNCYSHEDLGKFSDRMQYNRDYANYYNRITTTLPDGTVQDSSIPVLDIRFSNKCNYKCRICNINNSSLLYEEALKLGQVKPGTPKEIKAASDETVFWESYKDLLPGVKRLHFAGGEPLMMDEHYQALEHLIAIGNTDLTLSYNTNFSTLRYKRHDIINLWNQFRQVDVWASLDAMGEQGDYQRKGQRWKEIEENIHILQKKATTVLFGIDATVSVFNIFHIPAYYKYLVENKLVAIDRLNLYYLHDPDYFSVTNLTPHLKQNAIELYQNFSAGFLQQLSGTERIKEHCAALIKYMLSENLNKRIEFKNRISEIDELRNEKFTSVFPELIGMTI